MEVVVKNQSDPDAIKNNRKLETIEEIKAEFCKGVRLEHLMEIRKMLVRKSRCGNSEAAKLLPKLDQAIQRFSMNAQNKDFRPSIWDSID